MTSRRITRRPSGILLSTNETAATLTVGVDIFRNERQKVSSRLRFITGIVLVGSAAINDTIIDLFIEKYYAGRVLLSRAGVVAPIYPDDIQALAEAAVPPGSQISGIVFDAPATNPVICQIFGYEA
jgi:hypothetical protein